MNRLKASLKKLVVFSIDHALQMLVTVIVALGSALILTTALSWWIDNKDTIQPDVIHGTVTEKHYIEESFGWMYNPSNRFVQPMTKPERYELRIESIDSETGQETYQTHAVPKTVYQAVKKGDVITYDRIQDQLTHE